MLRPKNLQNPKKGLMPVSSKKSENRGAESPSRITGRLSQFFWGQVDPCSLRVFELCLALATLIVYGHMFLEAGDWLTGKGFHLSPADRHPLEPAPWPLLSPAMIPFFGLGLLGGVLCILSGRHVRIACAVLALLTLYAYHVDLGTVSGGSRLFIVGWFVLASAPPVITGMKGERSRSAAPLRILQLTLVLLYFTGGMAKLYGDWSRHGDVVWASMQGFYRTDLAAWTLRVFPLWIWKAVQVLVLVFELGSPLWFGWPRIRLWVLGFGLVFHVWIALAYASLWAFSLAALAYYPLFLTPQHLQSVFRRVSSRLQVSEPFPEKTDARVSR